MTIVCGKFFFHKKHKLPRPDEIKECANENISTDFKSCRSFQENIYSNYQTSFNDSYKPQKKNLNEDANIYNYSKGFSNWNESNNNTKNDDSKIKTNSLHLNMNYSTTGNDKNIRKNSKSPYFELPEDSFFANKLAKQPESKIKIHQ